MDTPDEIELQIQAALSSIAQNLDKCSDSESTERVKKVLEALGSRVGCEVRGGSSGSAKRLSEWLFDMAWVRRLSGQSIVDVELIAESEWKSKKEVQKDFQRIMVGRARHRLMIFPQRSRKLAWTVTNRLITDIQNFRLSQSGDRYLFAVWHNEGAAFEFRVYVHA